MKKYDTNDFRTFFAKQQAEQELATIKWDVLTPYFNTDIMLKIRQAVYGIAQRTGQIPHNGLPDTHENLKLSNGDEITPSLANDFAHAHGQHTYLRALEIIEQTFLKTTNLEKIVKDFVNEVDPPVGELNFPLVVKMYPAEATHIYFQMRFPEVIKDGFAYASISGYLNEQLMHNQMGPGPQIPPLNAFEALRLISQGWHNLTLDIQDYIIPELKRSRDNGHNGGPSFN